MGGRSWSVSFATESLSLVEMWRATSTCLADLNIDDQEFASLFYESPSEWFLDSGVKQTPEAIEQLTAESLGLVIDFTASMQVELYCSLLFFPRFPGADDRIRRTQYGATLRFGSMLDRQLYPTGYDGPAKETPRLSLMKLSLALATALQATAFTMLPNDEGTLDALTAQRLVELLSGRWNAWYGDYSKISPADKLKYLERFPRVLGVSSQAIDRQEFSRLLGPDCAENITESLSGYMIYSLIG